MDSWSYLGNFGNCSNLVCNYVYFGLSQANKLVGGTQTKRLGVFDLNKERGGWTLDVGCSEKPTHIDQIPRGIGFFRLVRGWCWTAGVGFVENVQCVCLKTFWLFLFVCFLILLSRLSSFVDGSVGWLAGLLVDVGVLFFVVELRSNMFPLSNKTRVLGL